MIRGRFIWVCTGAKALKYVQSALKLNHTTVSLQIVFYYFFVCMFLFLFTFCKLFLNMHECIVLMFIVCTVVSWNEFKINIFTKQH